MDKAVIVPTPPPPLAKRAPREVTKEFVRRPAKGWMDSIPVPVPIPEVQFDPHAAVWALS